MNKLPYFELKVVKVKKAVCHHNEVTFKNGIFRCNHCGQTLRIKRYDKNKRWGFIKNELQPNGNWVNGENIDAIKFPVPCSYGNHGKLGILLNGVDDFGKDIFELHGINNQISKYNCTRINHQRDLKSLIKDNNIHILKGKIIIFEEEK